MLWFKKRGKKDKKDKSEKETTAPRAGKGKGKSMLETVRAGLNSRWFSGQHYSILKEFEGEQKKGGILDDSSRERAIASILGSLESAAEAFAASGDQERLRDTAAYFLDAYAKIGDVKLLDRYMEVCSQAGMTQEEISERLIEAGDEARQIDVAVNLYSKAGNRDKLKAAGNRALNLYLEAGDMDMKTRCRLFHYVVEAYKLADDMEAMVQAGDKALKYQIDGLCLSREKDWVLDAQIAYRAAGDNEKLSKVADQYVNLYFKEGLGMWLDKAIDLYKEVGVDYASKLNRLADRVAEKGRTGMADTMRRKAEG